MIRIVMVKPGLDSHYRGALMVARHLARTGMEVIYLGNQTAEQTVAAVLQEDADVLGISSLSGSHLATVPPMVQLLHAASAGHVVVVVGGVVPEADIPQLQQAGVDAVFGPGADLTHIDRVIREAVWRKQQQETGLQDAWQRRLDRRLTAISDYDSQLTRAERAAGR